MDFSDEADKALEHAGGLADAFGGELVVVATPQNPPDQPWRPYSLAEQRLASRTVVSLLAGNGLPASLPALQMEVGQPLWNHVIFFGIAWLGTVVALDIE
jgi:hypothetical protein